MRMFTVASLVMGLLFQVGCALTMSPRATPMRLQTYNSAVAAQYVTAKQFESQGKLERARELYQEMLDRHPQNPDYLHRLAVVNTRLHRHGEASNLYERARKLDPKNASLLVDMGYSSYLNGDPSGAEQLLREALHLKPSDTRATNNLALVIGLQGKLDECLTLLQQVGSEADALASLAYIHSQRGEIDLAEQRYREALDIDPKLKPATRALAELSKRQPHQNFFITESTSPSDRTVRRAEATSLALENPAIQQVGVIADTVPRSVATAHFVAESSPSLEPALLDESHDSARRSTIREQRTTSVDETELADEEAVWASPETASRALTLQDDDWANDDPLTTKISSNAASNLPTDFDSTVDDVFSSMNPPASPHASSADQLTFGAPKLRSAQPVAPRAKTTDNAFPLPTVTLDPNQ